MTTRRMGPGSKGGSQSLGAGARGGPVILGLLVIVAGIFCMVAPMISGTTSVVSLGSVLAVSGLLQALGGVRGGSGQHRGLLVAGGLLALAVGLVMVARPTTGMLALTLLLAAFFFGVGVFSTTTSIAGRYPRWGWDLAFGLTALALAVTTLLWPMSKLWVLGTLVGIAVVVRGATMIAAELEGHARAPAPTGAA